MDVRITVIAGDFDLEKEIEVIEKEIAETIPVEARRIVDANTPSGRLYRVGNITGRRSAATIKAGLRPYRRTRTVIGSRIHRASAWGEPWAKRSGRAYRDITVTRVGRGTFRVIFGAPYIGFLEFKLNRPVVLPALEAAIKRVFG